MKQRSYLKIAAAIMFFALQCPNLFSQSGWYLVNPLPASGPFYGAKFINSNTGYLSGSLNSVLKTTNGGLNWTKNKLPGRVNPLSIDVLSNGAVVAACDSGAVCRSTDGGLTWDRIYVGVNKMLLRVYFINSNTGYIASIGGQVFKSVNSGLNWTQVLFRTSGAFMNLWASSDVVYACGDSVYKSTDGGNAWSNVSDSILTFRRDIYFLNSNTGYTAGDNRHGGFSGLVKTTNGGSNWFEVPNNDEVSLTGVFAKDENNIVTCGFSGAVKKTTNGGVSWTNVYQTSSYSWGIYSINQTELVLTGDGILHKSTNSGMSWQSLIQGYTNYLLDVDMVNGNTVFACGDDSKILKSVDGGNSWVSNKSGITAQLRDMSFFNASTGWAVGDSSSIMKTTDGGSTWTRKVSPQAYPWCVSFADNNVGIVGCGYGYYIKTTNGGDSWFDLSYITGTPSKIQMVNQSIVYVSSPYRIMKTIDGGTNWTFIEPVSEWFNGLSFTDANTGYVVSDSGKVFKTTNGGMNWTEKKVSMTPLKAVMFIDSQTGYTAGTGGFVFKTTNGGNNWAQQERLTSRALTGISFMNANTGFICGEGGTILKTTTGGTTFVSPIGVSSPKNYELSQNYPNPFNPVTMIKFSITKLSDVKIVVYDVMGREVQTLVNAKLQAGTYETNFDGSRLSSGVYFYKIQAEDFAATRKMLLVK